MILLKIVDTFFYGFHGQELPSNFRPCSASESINEQIDTPVGTYVAISTIGGALFMLIVIITLIVLLKNIHRKKRNSTSRLWLTSRDQLDNSNGNSILQHRQNTLRPPNLKLEASNPIYEGVLYETTPGETLKSLQSLPVTPSNDLTFRYTLDTTPQPPPPRKASKIQSQSRSTGCEADTAEYTIMNSTQSM